MVVVVTGAAIALKLGQLPHWMLFVCVSTSTMFYLTHWRAYVSGVVRFGLKVCYTGHPFYILFINIVHNYRPSFITRVREGIFAMH